LIRHLQVVGGVSKFVCRSIESEYRLPAGSARLLYNGIEDLPLPPPVGEGRSTSAMVIGAVGRCAPEKGFDVLLRAMVELPADCRLVLLGEGAEQDEDRVQFVGWVDPPWAATWKFDVLVAPSRVEAFGLVAVEAMRAKIPVIASGVGGFVEIIDDGSTGLLVEPGDPSALAVAIRRLSQDPVEHKAMAERAYDSVLGRFSVEAMAQAYVEVFDGIRKS
jgi:glycosyltransferase involved in cell wall biosynthesis